MAWKYSKEFKLECVRRYKNGEFVETPPGCKNRHTFTNKLGEWVRRYDIMGESAFDIHTFDLKTRLAAIRDLEKGESYTSVAIKYGVSGTNIIKNWENAYKNSGENGLKLIQRSFDLFMKPKKKKKEISQLSRKELEERLLQAEAENEYLKKLDALVQSKKKQQTKKNQS